jgi:hypothetical protein
MDPVPSDPETFFTSYLPARFTKAAERLGTATSVGSLTARIVDVGEWSLRITDGALVVMRGSEDDVMLQITTSLADFDVLVRRPITDFESEGRAPFVRVGPLRALVASPETARLVRHVPGSVLFIATDGDASHRLLVTPGIRKANMGNAECTIQCRLDDLRDAQEKGMPPMQLFVSGKLKISGNVQIAMALAGVLA